MKLVLIDARDRRLYPPKIAMPLGLCCLASYLREKVKNLEVVIREGYESSVDEDADVAGISAVTTFYRQALNLAARLRRERNIPLILGGVHMTALPHRLDPVFDAGVIGEGEETMAELMAHCVEKGWPGPDELCRIKGIAWNRDGKTVVNPPRELIKPLDSIPWPARELLDLRDRYILIQTSRGCPYRCAFCALLDFNRVYRAFSPEYVVSEIEKVLSGRSFMEISVVDDLFCANTKRLSEIAQLLHAKGLHRRISLGVTMRADMASEKVMEILKSLTIMKVYIGLESGSDRVLSYLKKDTTKVSDNQRALDLCYRAGIKVDGSFIIGSPGEEVSDLKATYEFIFNNYKAGKLSTVRIGPLTPFPGSQVWDYARDRGLVDEDMDWSRLEMSLGSFDPRRYVYLNEKIPLPEFLHYLDIFEDMMYSINRNFIRAIGIEEYLVRLDRDKIRDFINRTSPRP